MLVENILNGLNNGMLYVPMNEFPIYFKFLRELILDRHLMVYKPDAFAINGTGGGKAKERHYAIGESIIELSVLFMDKLALASIYNKDSVNMQEEFNARIDLQCGKNGLDTGVTITVPDLMPIAYGSQYEVPCGKRTVQILYTDPYLCRVVREQPVSLNISFKSGFGIRDAGKKSYNNVDTRFSNYFTCNTDYSIQDYVRVLPPRDDKIIRLKYYNGMTENIFKGLLFDYNRYMMSLPLNRYLESMLHKAVILYQKEASSNQLYYQNFIRLPYEERIERLYNNSVDTHYAKNEELWWFISFERSLNNGK